MKCKQCDGKGYTYHENTCPNCEGMGTVEWWETEEYKTTGKYTEEKTDPEKGYVELGLVGGVIVGIWVYMVTASSTTAVIVGVVTTLLAATLLRLFFKYLLVILVIGYVIYLLFG